MYMAKRKKKKSTHSESSHSNVHIWGVVWQILTAFIWLFLFASVFNAAGSLGGSIHFMMAGILGDVTPFFALVLIWMLLRKFIPNKVTLRASTIVGILLIVVALAGIYHSGVKGNLLFAAQHGKGGGYIGYMMFVNLSTWFGHIIGQIILYMLAFIGLIVTFEKWVVVLFHVEQAADESEDDDLTIRENQVPVKGELKASPMSLLKSRLGKPAVVKVEEAKLSTPRPTSRAISNWIYPASALLEKVDMKPQSGNLQKRIDTIEKTLKDFGIDVKMTDVNIGPTVTQFTLRPSDGVKLNQITARQDDLALALAAHSLRVEAPIPGKGLVGVEIPNDKKAVVGMREIVESKVFKQVDSNLAIVLGRDVAGAEAVADLTRMPHLLIAGSTGSGKSVCINSIIISLLMNNSPDELRMILVDPKRVELTGYNGLPHLLTPVITEPTDTVKALAWCVKEMERRYKLFASLGKRNIDQYNETPDLGEGHLPYIVLIVDELADLMMVAAREVEGSIVRLAQMARAVGIHLIIATQRPSVDVITGLIKANIPTRIAFAVASQVDSRTILDMAGAEKLLGYGDMLYISTETGKPRRIQGVFVPEKDINSVIAHIKMQEEGDRYDPAVLETRIESRLGGSREIGEVDDDLFQEAYAVVKQAGKASTTLLQTRLAVGYARAARLMQCMEDQGLIGPANGSKPREVYSAPMNGVGSEDGLEDYN